MRRWREAVVLLAVAVVPAAIAVAFHPQLADRARAGLEPGEVRLAEARGWRHDIVWVDARPADEFARGHIPQAMHFPLGEFDRALGELLARWSPEKVVVVYCSSASCATSRELAQRLREAGIEPVHHLRGGWEAWEEAAR